MKRPSDHDAHEDTDTAEPQVKVNDALLSFEKELDQMSESNRVKTGKSQAGGSKRRGHAPSSGDAEEEEDQAVVALRFDANEGVQPSCIKNGTMRYYQIEGLNWMLALASRKLNGILADEMGLGKTLQTISVLGVTTLELLDRKPHLVIVPLSVLGNWQREFAKWCPALKVVKLHGDKEARQHAVQQELRPGTFNVCVTTYEVLALEAGPLRKISWAFLVVDEAHRLKNENSRLAQIARSMSAAHRVLLTGTPIQNNLHELWALLNFLYPKIFTSSEPFDQGFDAQSGKVQEDVVQRLHRLLQGCLLRRLKTEVEKSMPPKKETKLFLPLVPMQAQWYRKVLMRDLQTLSDGRGGKGSTHAQNIVMHLRKVCNHPYLFEGAEPGPPFIDGEHMVENCGKMVVLDKLLKRLLPGGHRVLIFVTMTRMLDIIEDYCNLRKYEYCRLDGSTSTNDREAMMEEFNRPGSPKGIFMLSTRAGGLGINLFTADTVILYDSDWNPQQDLQAQDRAHRIGQTRPVNVYRFCMESTIEEKIIERAERKLFLDRMVVEQGRLTVQMPSAKGDELMSMIKFGADAVLKSNGASLTDADIDVLLTQGEARTAEMAAKLKTDCQMSLDNYNTQLEGGGSDLTKLYELDGVEYDAKGVRELIAQLRASEEAKRGKGDADGNGGDGSSVSSTLERMLTQQWNVLRNVRVCDEPGAHKREGQTIHDSVSRRLAAIARESAEAKEQGRPENSDNATEGAWYTIDKKEVQDRHWELVATILLQFGFEDISADSPQQRCMKIPLQLCTEFAERVVAPWQSAWRAFRASQRGNRGSEGGGGGAGTGTGTGTAAASSAGADTAAATALGLSEAASAGPPPGDSIFAWGCLDWVTTMTRAGDKKNERSAFIVSVPALVDQMPSALNGKQIRQLASGGRHIALCTEDGEVYAWGRGVAGCLGVGATGCAGHPMPVRSLALGKVKITSLSCGAEHTCLISDAGALYSCGAGKRGQLGLGHTDNSALPQRVAGVRGGSATRCAASVSCGGYHTAVLLKDGSLFTCGAHDNGVLGHALAGGGGEWEDTRLTDCTTLGQVHTLSANTAPVSVVSAGGLHNLALTSKGLYGWGAGSWGRLGMGGDNKDKNVPTFIKAAAHLGGLCGVAAGWEHSLLLTVDGSVFQFGRLGHSYMNLPQQVQGLGPNSGTPIESISAGRGYSLAVDTSGELWVWGAIGPSGALGLGEKDGNKVKNARTVTQIETLAGRRITQVAAGHVHMVVLADSGRSTASDMAVASEERFGSASQQVEEHSVCDVCKEGDEDGDLIFCDWCNKGYHAECHDPKLTNIPEGDWICFNCKLERFSSCNVCGMQDELSATLALCETDDCPHHGCVHIECLLAEERPPLKQDAKEADANDDADAEVDGGALDDSGRAEEGQAAAAEQRKEVVKKKPPAAPFGREAKKAWDISSFSWFCSKCCDEKGVAATKGSEHAAGGTHPAPAGKELTPAHRKLLKQYFELCKQPDQAELRLLASLTERGPVETKAWFEQKVAQEEAAARRAERERREKEQALKLQAEGGNGGASYTTPEMFSRQEQLKNQGNTSFAMKDYDAALRHYASAINIDPRDSGPQAHVLHSNVSAVYSSMGKWQEALRHGLRCKFLNPTFAKGYSRVGTAHANMNNYREAISAFEMALRLDPDNQRVRESLERVRASVQAAPSSDAEVPQAMKRQASAGSADAPPSKRPDTGPPPAAAPPAPNASELQQQGNQAYKQRNFDQAIHFFTLAIATYSDNAAPAQLFSNRSAALCGKERYTDALNDADWAVRQQPQWAKGHSRRANALHALRRLDDARGAYEKALELDPTNQLVRNSLESLLKLAQEPAPAAGAEVAGVPAAS